MIMDSMELNGEDIRGIYPKRGGSSRKGDNGRALIVGGNWLYHGAPVLAGWAAVRVGIDLLFLAVPRPIADPIRSFSPTFIVLPLPDYRFTKGSANRLIKMAPETDAMLVGNGFTREAEIGVTELLKKSPVRRLVLDAGALYPEAIERLDGRETILTPHIGEFRRISSVDLSGSGLNERIKEVAKFAAQKDAVVVLKGQVDIITDGRETHLNRTGNAGMTVGGTGDALAGACAAFLSRGVKPIHAAMLAAYFNGLAGDLARSKMGYHFNAMDVIEQYPLVMKEFDVTD